MTNITDPKKYFDIKTKKARLELIKSKIETNDRWLLKGLLVIFERQTTEEQTSMSVREHNGVGFTGFDAEFMTSIAQQLIQKGLQEDIADKTKKILASQYLTPAQLVVLRNKMKKYAGQLQRIAEEKN